MRRLLTAEHIAVGTELLLGTTINSNAATLGRALSDLGLSVVRTSVVGDNVKRIAEAIQTARRRADVVITTGGLGPTEDDVTREGAAEALGLSLYDDHAVWSFIEARSAAFERALPPNNRRQALVIEGATILPNALGSAPGQWIERPCEDQAGVLILLPGPPHEMTGMWHAEVLSRLAARTDTTLVHRFVRAVGLSEADAALRIAPLISAQTDPTIAIYAGHGVVMARVSTRATDAQAAAPTLDATVEAIQARWAPHVYTVGDASFEAVLVEALRRAGQTVAVAESMTGGRVASRLTAVPHVSSVFLGGVVSYQNASKRRELLVDPDVLAREGAVSETVACQMASGVRRRFEATWGLSTTGLAGPSANGERAPIGTCYIGLASPAGVVAFEHHLSGDRRAVMAQAVQRTLIHLWEAAKA